MDYRAAIEYEKKVYADSFEQGQMLQSNLLTMARELEKLRAEIANAEKRARAAAAAGNPGIIALMTIYFLQHLWSRWTSFLLGIFFLPSRDFFWGAYNA